MSLPKLQRCSSSESSSSNASSVNNQKPNYATLNDTTVSYVPYLRKRVAPVQRQALQRMFEVKSHPTREERLILASEIGMELKSVTNWFQNKRQTAKRKALVWNGDRTSLEDEPRSNSFNLDPIRRSFLTSPTKSRSVRPTVSLDHIAELCEQPPVPSAPPTSSNARPPLTPCKTRRIYATPPSKAGIWSHMPSSPIVPQSSPSIEEERLAALPSRSKTWRSLEWACLKARRSKRTDDDELPRLSNTTTETDDETDTELEDPLTPIKRIFPPTSKLKHGKSTESSKNKENQPVTVVSGTHQSEDVEAAMLLLGFMGKR